MAVVINSHCIPKHHVIHFKYIQFLSSVPQTGKERLFVSSFIGDRQNPAASQTPTSRMSPGVGEYRRSGIRHCTGKEGAAARGHNTDAFHRHTAECQQPDLEVHTHRAIQPYHVQILAKLINGERGQNSGYPRGALDGTGHEEAGEGPGPHLVAGTWGAPICSNSSFLYR